jgi:hypothetical protein
MSATPRPDTVTLLVLAHRAEAGARARHAARAELLAAEDFTRHLTVSTTLDEEPAQLVSMIELEVARTDLVDATRTLAAMIDPSDETVLEVEKRTIASYERTWGLRSPSPGERMVSLCRRKAGLTRDEFATYWRDVHAPIALAFTVNPSGYVQYVTVRRVLGQLPEPDGVMVMHFLDRQDRLVRWNDHPAEAARGYRDAVNFMDLSSPVSAVMEETVWS